MKRLICSLPNPGEWGIPRGMFYPDTPDGHRLAEDFARLEDRPGWGVFDCVSTFHDDADLDTMEWVLNQNGISVR